MTSLCLLEEICKALFSSSQQKHGSAGVNLPNTLIFDYPTISAIADFTSSQMGPGPAPAGILNDQLFRCVSKKNQNMGFSQHLPR